MSQRLLIISHDVVGARMAGPGIRAWELARALAQQLAVTLLAPRPIDLTPPPGLQLGSYTPGNAASLAPWLAASDAIFANGAVLAQHPELAACSLPLLLDLYDPFFFENLELFRTAPAQERAARAAADRALLHQQLQAGHGFVCATEQQRDLYLGGLMLAGRITPEAVAADPLLRRLIDVVPFGLPAEPPVRTGPGLRQLLPQIGPDAPLILWSGGLWDWMDPVSLVQAMPAVLERYPEARLVFLAGAHPGSVAPMSAAAQARAEAARLGLLDQQIIFYESWVPYAERANYLLDADLLVSLHHQHLETNYAAVRSRVLDHFWVGRPSLLSDGDAAAQLIRDHDLGMLAPAGDVRAISAALLCFFNDPFLRAKQGQQAHRLAEHLTWPQVIEPILRFVHDPPPRPLRQDQLAPPLAQAPVNPGTARLLAQRQTAIRLLEARWNELHHPPVGASLITRLRHRVLSRLVRPLLPLLAAQIQTNYTLAELGDQRTQALEQQLQVLRDHVHTLELRIQQ